jgi:hypothetical protein
MHFEV